MGQVEEARGRFTQGIDCQNPGGFSASHLPSALRFAHTRTNGFLDSQTSGTCPDANCRICLRVKRPSSLLGEDSRTS